MTQQPKYTPYWWEAAPPREMPDLDVEASCDVVIVGAGYAGISAALTLARAGRSVQVFDASNPGIGASTRNGGIGSGNLKPSITKLIKTYGPMRATAMYAEGVAARADLKLFIEEEGIDCQFSLSGRFGGACRADHYNHLERDADLLNGTFNIGATMVERADQHAEIGTDYYHGGIVRPDIGGLHPAMLHQAMLERAEQAGVLIHGMTAVQSVRRDGAHYEVMTTGGAVTTGDVIVCTNGYTDGAIPWLRRRVVPVASQIIVTEPLAPEVMDRLMPKRRMMTETAKMGHYYRPTPDGTRILFGGRIYGNHVADQELPYDHLYKDMVQLFPELDSVGISHVWWGFVAFPMDQMPHLVVRDGVHYATGFSGSGVVWARWFGMKAAYRVLGQGDAKGDGESAFADRMFHAVPFYEGRPWFLPAVQAWFAMRDKIGI
jgi:glycine/D-amino acid oxidase-like deaminating enzyme